MMGDESPSKKKLKLGVENKRVTRSNSTKHKLPLDDPSIMISPLKRLKISSSKCVENKNHCEARSSNLQPSNVSNNKTSSSAADRKSTSRTENFMMACVKVSSEEFYDVQAKLGLKELPDCCVDPSLCNIRHGKASDIVYTAMSTEREAIKIYLRHIKYTESLRICRDVLKFNIYPSYGIMIDLIHIILHCHDSKLDSAPSQMILLNCINIFINFFSLHPPCHKSLRKNYTDFLMKPFKLDSKDDISIDQDMNNGLFKFIIKQLEFEIASESEDHLLEIKSSGSQSENLNTIDDIIKLNDTYHTYGNLKRKERIKRLFFILEIIIELLERDLAIWITKHIYSTKSMLGPHKPLISVLLWKTNALYTGQFNDTCANIIKLFITIIKQKNSVRYVPLYYRLINIMFRVFHLCEENHSTNFPNYGKYSNLFVKEMFKNMQDENITIVMKIINAAKCHLLQHLLSCYILKQIINTKEENFMQVALSIFKNRSWTKFAETKCQSPTTIENTFETDVKSKFKDQRKQHYNTFLTNINSKIKHEFTKNSNNISEPENLFISNIDIQNFLQIFCCSLKSFLECHNIEKIKFEYDNINAENIPLKKENCEWNDFIEKFNTIIRIEVSDKDVVPLPLNSSSIKYYRSIFQFLEQISEMYNEVKHTDTLLRALFKNIVLL